MNKQNRKNNGFKTLLLLMGLGALVGCKKPPVPEPQPTPTDSIPETPVTPVKPYDTIVWDLHTAPSWAPSHDTIRNHLKPGLKKLTLHIIDKTGANGHDLYWINSTPQHLHRAREELQSDIELDTTLINLYGSASVKVIGTPGYVPTNEEEGTIQYEDAQYLMQHGLRIVPRSKQH